MDIAQILALFVGKTVKSITSHPMNADGTGKRLVVIEFTKKWSITFETDNFTVIRGNDVSAWLSYGAAQGRAQVLDSVLH